MKSLLDRLHENIIVASRQNGDKVMKPVDQHKLETFVSGKFHWKSLTPDAQRSMAIELLKARYLLQQQYNYVGDLLDGRDTKKHTP